MYKHTYFVVGLIKIVACKTKTKNHLFSQSFVKFSNSQFDQVGAVSPRHSSDKEVPQHLEDYPLTT